MTKDDAKDLVGLLVGEANTGYSFHMTLRRDVFLDLQELTAGKVRMANN